jgi:APA family basic amino acid/polyamine antiporter
VQSQGLKREVGLAGAISYGVGVIVGAGIYALVGKVAGFSGNAIWVSFLLGAAIASFTGLSYAELSRLIPSAGGEYDYVLKASRREFLAFIIGWLVILTGIISAAAVALGFAGYLKAYIGVAEPITATLLVLILSALSYWGIRESIWLNAVFTSIEVVGLIIVIIVGIPFIGSVNYLEYPQGLQGIIFATALVIFAYLGFEGIVKLGEETKEPEKTIPKAIIASIIITTVLYALVGIAAVSVVPYQQLASSSAPIADIALKAQGEELYIALSTISLIATTNTVLILLIATSRILYHVAKRSSISFLSKVHHKRGTPHFAILITAAMTIPFAFLGDIEFVASVTNFITFAVFFTINVTVLVLVQQGACCTGPLRHGSIKRMPVIAILGAVSSLLMLFQFSLAVAAISFLTAILGAIIYVIITR